MDSIQSPAAFCKTQLVKDPDDEGGNVLIIEDYLQRGERIDFIFTHFDGMSLGALTAIEAAGLEDEITVVGIDGTVAGLDAVRQGKMYGTTWIYRFNRDTWEWKLPSNT